MLLLLLLLGELLGAGGEDGVLFEGVVGHVGHCVGGRGRGHIAVVTAVGAAQGCNLHRVWAAHLRSTGRGRHGHVIGAGGRKVKATRGAGGGHGAAGASEGAAH